MKWKRIPKELSAQPRSGKYEDWKPRLRAEGEQSCVYCRIHESSFGGHRNYHVEHFRPKEKFKKLRNRFSNLFYSCSVCNSYKGDDWPKGSGNGFGSPSFPDPGKVNLGDAFQINWLSGKVKGRDVTGKFLITRLHLNRAQLISERRLFGHRMQVRAAIARLTAQQTAALKILDPVSRQNALHSLSDITARFARLLDLHTRIWESAPYGETQLRA